MSPWPTTIYRLWQVLSSSDEDGDHDDHDDHDDDDGDDDDAPHTTIPCWVKVVYSSGHSGGK